MFSAMDYPDMVPATMILEHCDGAREEDGRIYLPFTLWGHYVGGVIERANATALLEEYEGVVRVECGAFYSEECYVFADEDVPALLIEDLVGLEDYPVLNDEALWEVEQAIMEDDLKSFVLADVRGGFPDEEDYAWPDAGCDPFDPDDDEALTRAIFQDIGEHWDYGPEAETATSCYWRDLDVMAERLVERIEVSRAQTWDEYARTYLVHPDQGVLV